MGRRFGWVSRSAGALCDCSVSWLIFFLFSFFIRMLSVWVDNVSAHASQRECAQDVLKCVRNARLLSNGGCSLSIAQRRNARFIQKAAARTTCGVLVEELTHTRTLGSINLAETGAIEASQHTHTRHSNDKRRFEGVCAELEKRIKAFATDKREKKKRCWLSFARFLDTKTAVGRKI